METGSVLKLLAELPFRQIGEIDKEKLIFSQEVRRFCECNSCGDYGKNWMCPPGVGEVGEWQEKILGYRHAVLFNYVGEIEDSFDFESMMEIGTEFGRMVRQIKTIMTENQADFLLLGAGGCHLCKTCTYPDAPCRRPEDTIPSMEGCGLFVAKIAEPCGFKYINGENTVTYFGLLMFN